MTERERSLLEVRKGVWDFFHRIPDYSFGDPIVEVGKMSTAGKVYEQFPEYYVDTKELFAGRELIQLDLDPATEPDICDDVVHIDRHFERAGVGAVLMIHVLEHVRELWKVPEKLAEILQPEGLVFIQSPWNFRFHGPRPDCWRISDDGYDALFGAHFEIVELEKVNPFEDYLHPLMINVVLRKRT